MKQTVKHVAQARHALTASVPWQDDPRYGDRLRVIATVHDAPAGQVILAHRACCGALTRRTVGATRRGAL